MNIDFTAEGSPLPWRAIDDRVMGGLSKSELVMTPAGFSVFKGVVSLAQGGGFASVRAPLPQSFAVGSKALYLQVLGDGRRYKLALRMDSEWDGVSYQAAFQPPDGAWTEIVLCDADFSPTFRGCGVSAPDVQLWQVRQIGFILADRQSGRFALGLKRLSDRPMFSRG
ncbi:MAG: CIA30 family protein [Sphingobacteriia bacterium]|nr:CIA30 family protein [Sphingobacteriia bacterium]NCC41489.1 CIA30 family protein [Gammaproteobacteria bacterium]